MLILLQQLRYSDKEQNGEINLFQESEMAGTTVTHYATVIIPPDRTRS